MANQHRLGTVVEWAYTGAALMKRLASFYISQHLSGAGTGTIYTNAGPSCLGSACAAQAGGLLRLSAPKCMVRNCLAIHPGPWAKRAVS